MQRCFHSAAEYDFNSIFLLKLEAFLLWYQSVSFPLDVCLFPIVMCSLKYLSTCMAFQFMLLPTGYSSYVIFVESVSFFYKVAHFLPVLRLNYLWKDALLSSLSLSLLFSNFKPPNASSLLQ